MHTFTYRRLEAIAERCGFSFTAVVFGRKRIFFFNRDECKIKLTGSLYERTPQEWECFLRERWQEHVTLQQSDHAKASSKGNRTDS